MGNILENKNNNKTIRIITVNINKIMVVKKLSFTKNAKYRKN